jgi:hypothetical protein
MAKESVKVTLLHETAYEHPERGHHVDGKKDEVVETTEASAARLIALAKAKPATKKI